MNTLVRIYKVNFVNGNFSENLEDDFRFTDYTMQCVEYVNDLGTKLRTVVTDEINKMMDDFSKIILRDQMFDGEKWIFIHPPIEMNATRNTFINTVTNVQVTSSDAWEAVDDLTKEILDVGDVSFDPKQYEQKTALKTDIKTELDNIVSLVGGGTITNHDFHASVIMNVKSIQIPA